MKKILFLAVLILPLLLSGCSSDEDSKFDYDINILYGKWVVEQVATDKSDGYVDAEGVIKTTYAIFNQDGTYTGKGFFGDGSGTYKAEGKTITTYISGKEYLKYEVLSISAKTAELKVYMTGSDESIKIKCEKK